MVKTVMHGNSRRFALLVGGLVSLAAPAAFAIDDVPGSQPVQGGPIQGTGEVTVQGQGQVTVPGQGQVTVQGQAQVQGQTGFVPSGQPGAVMVTGPQPVAVQPVVVTRGQRYAQARRGLYFQVQGGPGFGVAGSLAQNGFIGAFANALAGWEVPNGLSGFVELGFRYHPATFLSTTDGSARDASLVSVPLGIGGRWTPLRELMIHPVLGVAADIHFMWVADRTLSESPRITYTFGVGAIVGAELDLHENFSIELALRADLILSGRAWSNINAGGAHDFLLTPYLAGTYYY
jgi:hypothetical protein